MRLAALPVLALLASPALATGDLICEATDGSGARVALAVGHLPVLAILNAEIEARGRRWTYNRDGGEPVRPAQAFRDSTQTLVDFTDEAVNHVVAELRLHHAAEGREHLEVGWLRLPGIGLHPLSCIGN